MAPASAPAPLREEATAAAARELSFDALYEEEFAFVWRSCRRLGVADAALDDVVQEVFLVVHRRFHDFERRSSLRTWLFGIVVGVVRNHRRTARRKDPPGSGEDADDLPSPGLEPHAHAEQAEAARLVHRLLDALDEDKREVFVLAELEQLTAPEIAAALALNLNTVYSRLRAARLEFERALERERARERWKSP